MRAKDLYKKLSRNNTSEQLWNISEQPEETCPMINSTIEDLKIFRSKIINAQFKLKEYKDVQVECHKEEFQNFLDKVMEVENKLVDWNSSYEKLGKELESLRSYITILRSTANSFKESLWDAIDRNIEIDTGEEIVVKQGRYWPTPSGNRFKGTDRSKVEILSEEINSLENIEAIETDLECKDCEIAELYKEVNEVIKELKPADILPDKLAEIDNREKIEEWAQEVFDLHISTAADYFIDYCTASGYQIINK